MSDIPVLMETSPHQVLEEVGMGFDPSTQHVDLSKDEKRRTTALLMAIQAYQNLIIKDAEYYIAAKRDERNGDGPIIRPATMEAMVNGALLFDAFIEGKIRPVEVTAEEKPDKPTTKGSKKKPNK